METNITMAEKPNYGSPTWHVVSNAMLGSALILVGVIAGVRYSPLLYLLIIPSIYFLWSAYGWSRGGYLEERLRIREEFIRAVGVGDGERILDVGTGSGFLAIGFAKAMREGEVVGIDIWMPMGGGTTMENALRNAEIEGVSDRVEFRRADAREIPYPDGHFDRVVASFTIHIIRDWPRALREMVRVLKPGGVLALLEPGRGWASGWKVERVVEHLKELSLKQVKLQPLTINFPKRRTVYLIKGVKTGGRNEHPSIMELAGRFEGAVDYTGEVKEEVERLFLQRHEETK